MGENCICPRANLKMENFWFASVSLTLLLFFLSFFSLFLCKVKMSVETEYWISCLRISIQFPLILEQKREAFWVLFLLFLVFDVKHRRSYLFQDMFTFFQYQKQEYFFLKINMFPTNKYVPKQRKIAIW